MKLTFLFWILFSRAALFALEIEFDMQYYWEMAFIEDAFPYYHEESGTLIIVHGLVQVNMGERSVLGEKVHLFNEFPGSLRSQSNKDGLIKFARENNTKYGQDAIKFMPESLQSEIKRLITRSSRHRPNGRLRR